MEDQSTVLGIVDVQDGDNHKLFVYLYLPFFVAAHITVHSQQGAIAIAIRSPSKASASSLAKSDAAAVFTSELHQPAIFGNPSLSPTLTPTAPPPSPILSALPLTPTPFVPSQTTSTWGLMMMADEVRELLSCQPQVGEYYVIMKGRRPGIYLSW